MKEIKLTKEQIAIVDDWNYNKINRHKWYAKWCKSTQSYYAARSEGSFLGQKTILMHREIMNTPKGLECDHINHDTLFNVEKNLRNVTHSQNEMNSRAKSSNKLGERGITRYRLGFRVDIYTNYKRVFCKNFKTLEDAIIARDEAIKKYHKEFAYTKCDMHSTKKA